MRNDEEGLEYKQARDRFVAKSQRDLQENLSRLNLWKEGDPLMLRIVSSSTLYDFIKDTEERDIERETGDSLSTNEKKGEIGRAHV